MRESNYTTEIDFTDRLKEVKADKEAGYPPDCNEGYVEKDGKCVKKGATASEDEKECENENCECECDSEQAQAEHESIEVDEYDIGCPSCGCALGRSWMKAGTMKKAMYASKYSELYKKVKGADPQHNVEEQPEIKTSFESKRKIEDMPNAVELRDVDEPIGND